MKRLTTISRLRKARAEGARGGEQAVNAREVCSALVLQRVLSFPPPISIVPVRISDYTLSPFSSFRERIRTRRSGKLCNNSEDYGASVELEKGKRRR